MNRNGASPPYRCAALTRWNLGRGSVSARCVRIAITLVVLFVVAAPLGVEAQAQPETGYELALSGPGSVRSSRDARYRGVAYRVRGLSTLVPYVGEVRARFLTATEMGEWRRATADAHGRFEVAVPIGIGSDEPRIEVEVGPEGAARSFVSSVQVEAPLDVRLVTDRVLYEAGEPVHVWALVRDSVSGAPLVHDDVAYEITGTPLDRIERTISTNEAGVASFSFTLAAHAPEGWVSVAARIEGVQFSTNFRVGQRVWERIFAHAEVLGGEIAPGAEATVRVAVTTPDAAPVRDASVTIDVAGQTIGTVTTDASGVASLVVHAPAYLSGDTGVASVQAHVSHPAYGSTDVGALMRVAVPLSLSIDVIAAHHALTPELEDVLYVSLIDSLGHPPPAGTRVEVSGAAVPRGTARAETDVNGLAEVPVRLPIGASAGPYDERRASLSVHVLGGPLDRLARLTVPVELGPEVLPTTAHPVVAPGATLEVALARRPSAERSVLIVELLDVQRREPLDVVFVPAHTSVARLHVPVDRIGRFAIRARAVHEDESLEGSGGATSVLVVPAGPDFVTLAPERQRWQVGETAHVDLVSRPNGPRAWGAILVRDLAAHGGEVDFAAWFLERAYDEALLHPEDAVSERLVRISLAAETVVDGAPPIASPLVDELGLSRDDSSAQASSPERDVLRDPWPLARELERRGAGQAMNALESSLSEALDAGGLDDLTEGTGVHRHFRADVLSADDYPTLGDGGTTPAMLTAVDPSFSYEHVARRVARVRLVALLASLASYLDPGDDASLAARTAYREPWQRWLGRMVERGVIADTALDDPWGGRFALTPSAHPTFVLSTAATGVELVSPGPDGRLGTADDVRDPFVRVVPAGTPYAVASGEDALMRALAILSPVERTLPALRAAYQRISAEMTEDEIGDAVHASVSEGTIGLGGFGTVGYGSGGGGSGSGYGMGSGGLGVRGASSVTVRGGGSGNFARLVRERFPPTVLFTPTFEVDGSGHTRLDIPLADAVTTYRVEVIVWRADGWIWSARTEIQSDREIVVDAPIPNVARVGDRLALPVRVGNRGTSARTLRLALLGDDTLGIPDGESVEVTVQAGGSAAVPFEVTLTTRGEGSLRVVATDTNGDVLDAVRRPLQVVMPARTVRVVRETFVEGQGVLAIDVPPSADALTGSLELVVGAALFPAPSDPTYEAWVMPPRTDDPYGERIAAIVSALGGGAPSSLGFAIGAAYARPTISDEAVRTAAEVLTTGLDARSGDSISRLSVASSTLLGLSRAASGLDARPALANDVRRLIDRLAREVGDAAVGLDGHTDEIVLAAAALATAGGERSASRATELLRRAEPDLVMVGDDLWVAVADHATRTTLAFSRAELSLGHRARAFALLATVARWRSRGRWIGAEDLALARAIATELAGEQTIELARVAIDGTSSEIPLLDGADTADEPVLATSGSHHVAIDVGEHVAVHAIAHAQFGVPWETPPERPGPFVMSLEGQSHGQDEVAELELVVANRSPRWIGTPVVEITLPTGAELTAAALARMRSYARSVDASASLLRVVLEPLAPGAERRVVLPIRWSVAGTLAGIGAAAYATDREDAVSVLLPAPIEIAPLAGGAP